MTPAPIVLQRARAALLAAVFGASVALSGALSGALPVAMADTGPPDRPSEAAQGEAVQQGEASTMLAVLDAEASFGRYATTLEGAGLAALERLLGRLDPLDEILSIRITGHADSRGPHNENLLLSRKRAESVATLLRERLPGVRVLAVGLGEAYPIADNTTAEGRALNRRVEIQILAIGRPSS